MDDYGVPDRLCEMDESSNFQEFVEDDVFNAPQPDDYEGLAPDWLEAFVVTDGDDPVLNDKMISEAAHSPRVRSEHSYSMSRNGSSVALDVEGSDDDENVEVHEQEPLAPATAVADSAIRIKAEPVVIETRRTCQQQSLLRPQAPMTAAMVVLTAAVAVVHRKQRHHVTAGVATPATVGLEDSYPPVAKVSIKVEPDSICGMPGSPLNSPAESMDYYSDSLPPTPPSSSTSDSDGGSGGRLNGQSRSPSPAAEVTSNQQLAVSQKGSRTLSAAAAVYSQPIPTTGALTLTEEEKRTLVSEGYAVPTRLPLTKQEERNLKKVRRKIKNKISAQESRRKKKEYVDTLERRVEDLARDNADLRRKCDSFETSNRSLLSQLHKLQAVVKGALPRPSASTAQAGTCLAVLMVCFAVFVGNWAPGAVNMSAPSLSRGGGPWSMLHIGPDAYATPAMKSSRTLMHVASEDYFDEDVGGSSSMLMPFCRSSFKRFVDLVGLGDEKTAGGVPPLGASVANLAVVPTIVMSAGDEYSSGGRVVLATAASVDIERVLVAPLVSSGSLSSVERTVNVTD